MSKRQIKRKKLKRKIQTIRFIFLIILLVGFVSITPKLISTAKYVYNVVHDYYLSSKDFYFSSDKLSINHTEYEITNNWSGAETYVITVNMSSKENDKAYTEADIEYQLTATCSDNISCTLSKNTGTIIGKENNGVNEDYFTISINPAGASALSEGETAWVEITATSTAPYAQTLSGKLILEVGSSEISYEIMDAPNQPYLTVNITNSQSVGSNVTLQYDPHVVLLDMTDRFYLNGTQNTTEQMNQYDYLNSITSYAESLSTTTVKFYKVDATQNYSYNSSSSGTPVILLVH